jgi:hypothetical protein
MMADMSPKSVVDRNNASDTMSPPHETSAASKRKSEDGGAPQPRAKRNRYISIAWFEALNIVLLVCID